VWRRPSKFVGAEIEDQSTVQVSAYTNWVNTDEVSGHILTPVYFDTHVEASFVSDGKAFHYVSEKIYKV